MKHLLSFEKLNEGKLLIEDSFVQEVAWDQTINISKLWTDYENGKIDLTTYNEQLVQKIKENLKSTSKFKDVLKDLKKATTEEESIPLWNKLYDIADENLVELK